MSRSALALLLLAGCTAVAGPSGETPFAPNHVTDAAAVRAMTCGAAHGLRPVRNYSHLRLYLVPGYPITVAGRKASGYTVGGKVWLAAPLADEPSAWAHEMVHALFGLPGMTRDTHHPAFAACGLLDL